MKKHLNRVVMSCTAAIWASTMFQSANAQSSSIVECRSDDLGSFPTLRDCIEAAAENGQAAVSVDGLTFAFWTPLLASVDDSRCDVWTWPTRYLGSAPIVSDADKVVDGYLACRQEIAVGSVSLPVYGQIKFYPNGLAKEAFLWRSARLPLTGNQTAFAVFRGRSPRHEQPGTDGPVKFHPNGQISAGILGRATELESESGSMESCRAGSIVFFNDAGKLIGSCD